MSESTVETTIGVVVSCTCGAIMTLVPDDSETVGGGRYVCPRCPDVRPATELTPERLEACGWALDILNEGWCAYRALKIDDEFEDFLRTPQGLVIWRDNIAGCYPCRDGKPWQPVPWAEVDEIGKGSEA